MPKSENPKEGLTDTWGRQNRKLQDMSCENCKEIFRPLRSTSRYCSKACMWANNGGHNKKDESWWINRKGYVEGRIWVDEHTRVQIKQHRWIMEQHLGRRLKPGEDVHHRDGNKTNNALHNLELIDHGEHTKHHNSKRIYKRGYKLRAAIAKATNP